MGRIGVLVGVATVAIAASVANGATGRLVHESAQSASWHADLSYTKKQGFPPYSDLHLTLLRGTQLVLDEPVVSHLRGASYLQPGAYRGRSIAFRQLDNSHDPELLLSLFTGGAHCCFITQVFDLTKAAPKKTEISFGDAGAQIESVNGREIFKGADDRFDYAFTDYADSGSPVQAWAYSSDRFHDVTRSLPSLITADAAFWWKTYRQFIKTHRDERGILGAWAADEALLGQAVPAKQTLLQIAFSGRLDWGFGGAKGSSFVRNLWKFLTNNGYLR